MRIHRTVVTFAGSPDSQSDFEILIVPQPGESGLSRHNKRNSRGKDVLIRVLNSSPMFSHGNRAADLRPVVVAVMFLPAQDLPMGFILGVFGPVARWDKLVTAPHHCVVK